MKYRTIKKLNNWLKENGFENISAYRDKEFAYLYKDSQEKISVGDGIPYISFQDLYKIVENSLEYSTDSSTLCFLHELGHYSTWEEFGILDELFDRAVRKIIGSIDRLLPNLKVYSITEKIYHRLPQEKRATMWAVDYINNNRKETEKLQEILLDK